MVFGKKILKILLRDFVWEVISLLRSLAAILQHSDPYNRIDRLQLLFSLSFLLVVH